MKPIPPMSRSVQAKQPATKDAMANALHNHRNKALDLNIIIGGAQPIEAKDDSQKEADDLAPEVGRENKDLEVDEAAGADRNVGGEMSVSDDKAAVLADMNNKAIAAEFNGGNMGSAETERAKFPRSLRDRVKANAMKMKG